MTQSHLARGRWQRSISASVLGWTLLTTAAMVAPIAPQAALAQDPILRTLTVTGRGKQSVQTTLSQVTLGVEVQGRTAQEVQAEVARRSDSVVNYLRSRNVDRLETVGIHLNPQYDYQGGRTILVGYSGSNVVSFRFPTEQTGALLDGAIAAGASQIQGISFIAPDSALATARQAALQAATADAQAQANAVLSYLNLGAQEVISIQIDGAQAPIPFPLPANARLSSVEADVSTPVIGGEQTVEAVVTLVIRY